MALVSAGLNGARTPFSTIKKTAAAFLRDQFSLPRGTPIIQSNVGQRQGLLRIALVYTGLDGARTPFCTFNILTAAHWLISLGAKGYTHHSTQRRPTSRLAKDSVGEYKPRRCQNTLPHV